jgi:hypothetical protein
MATKKTKIANLIDILNEYEGLLNITDFNLVVQGCLLTHIYYNEEFDKIQYFAGDIVEDHYAEELFPTDEEFDKIYNLVVEIYD